MAAAIDGRGDRALQLLLLLALVLGAAGACDCDFANGPPAVVRCVQPQTHLVASLSDFRERDLQLTPENALQQCAGVRLWLAGAHAAMDRAQPCRLHRPERLRRVSGPLRQRAMVCLVSRAKV
jgi:hypothetical protein